MMGWRILPAKTAFPELAGEWDRLDSEIHSGHPRFDSQAIVAALASFGDQRDRLCVHSTTEVIDGALILRPSGLGRWSLFLPPPGHAGVMLLRDGNLLSMLFTALPGYPCAIEFPALDPQFPPSWAGVTRPRTVDRGPPPTPNHGPESFLSERDDHRLYRSEFLAFICRIARTIRSGNSARGASGASPRNVRSYQSVRELPAKAARLIDGFARTNVEFSLEWLNNLQETVYPRDSGVRYYVAEFNGCPRAVLPVHLTNQGRTREIEALGNYYTSLFSPILEPGASAADLTAILRQADADHSGAHAMRFSPMDPDSPAFEALLTALRSCGWVPFRFLHFGNWYLKVEENWTGYLGKRSGTLRSTIKRMKKKFANEGGAFRIVTQPSEVEAGIQAFQTVYGLSWKKPEPYPEFISGLARWLAEKGELRLGIATLNDRPVAAQVWVVRNGRASIFKLAYDGAFADYSPGTLLTAHLMEYAIDRDGVKEVDYLKGDDEYKRSWMNHRRERWGIVAYNPRAALGFAMILREIAGRLLRRIFQRPTTIAAPSPSPPAADAVAVIKTNNLRETS